MAETILAEICEAITHGCDVCPAFVPNGDILTAIKPV